MLEILLRILNSLTFHSQSYFFVILFFCVFNWFYYLSQREYYNLFLSFLSIFISLFFIISCMDFFYYALIYKMIFLSLFYRFLYIILSLLEKTEIMKYKFDQSLNDILDKDYETLVIVGLILFTSFLEYLNHSFQILSFYSLGGIIICLLLRYLYFYFDTYIKHCIDIQFNMTLVFYTDYILHIILQLVSLIILFYCVDYLGIIFIYFKRYIRVSLVLFVFLFTFHVFFLLEKLADKIVVNMQFSSVDRVRTLSNFFKMIFKIIYSLLLFSLIIEPGSLNRMFAASALLGFAFQDFFRSLLNGLLVLWEDTVNIGEFVEIGGVSGEVQEISLRIIKLRDFEGSLFIIPFHKIDVIRNRGKDFVYVVFRVSVAPRANVNEVLELMQQAFDNINKIDNFKNSFLKEIEVIGLSSISSAGMVFEARVKIRPANTRMIKAAYYKELKILFHEKDISFGYEYWLVANKKGVALTSGKK